MVKCLLKPLILSILLAIPLSIMANTYPAEKYESWQKYYQQNKSTIQDYMNPSYDMLQSFNPIFANRMFLLGNHHVETTTTMTCTTPERPNYFSFGPQSSYTGSPDDPYFDEPGFDDFPYDCQSEEPQCTSTEDKNKYNWRIEPIVFFEFDSGRKIVNLSPNAHQPSLTNATRNMSVEDMTQKVDVNQVETKETAKGYQVTRYSNWEAGLGLAATLQYTGASDFISLFKAYVALLPMKGRSIKMIQWARDLEAVKSLPPCGFLSLLRDLNLGKAVIKSPGKARVALSLRLVWHLPV